MNPLLVFPDPAPPELAQTLDLGGFPWKAVANAAVAEDHERGQPWGGAIIVADEDLDGALSLVCLLYTSDAADDYFWV